MVLVQGVEKETVVLGITAALPMAEFSVKTIAAMADVGTEAVVVITTVERGATPRREALGSKQAEVDSRIALAAVVMQCATARSRAPGTLLW